MHLLKALKYIQSVEKDFKIKGLIMFDLCVGRHNIYFWTGTNSKKNTGRSTVWHQCASSPPPALALVPLHSCFCAVVCTGFNRPAWWRESKRLPRMCPTWPSGWSRYCKTAWYKEEVQPQAPPSPMSVVYDFWFSSSRQVTFILGSDSLGGGPLCHFKSLCTNSKKKGKVQ